MSLKPNEEYTSKFRGLTVSNVTEKFNYINTKELPTGFSNMGLIVDFAKNIFFGSMYRNRFVVCYKRY